MAYRKTETKSRNSPKAKSAKEDGTTFGGTKVLSSEFGSGENVTIEFKGTVVIKGGELEFSGPGVLGDTFGNGENVTIEFSGSGTIKGSAPASPSNDMAQKQGADKEGGTRFGGKRVLGDTYGRGEKRRRTKK